MVAYYQYLNGERGGTSPGKEELLVRVAQQTTVRSGNPRALHAALSKMPGAEEFCSREPYLEGEEVFGSMKRKLDLPPGSEHDSHRPDKVNFSRPRVELRSSKTCSNAQAYKDDPPEPSDADIQLPRTEKEVTPRVGPKVTYVTTVQETACDETQWHIARLPKTSAKACFAQQAITKKKCIAKIVQDGKSTAAPTYTGMMDSYKKNKLERMQFFFCNDDIDRCVKGTKRKWVKSRLEVPEVWPMKMGTNLNQKEILALEKACFQLLRHLEMSPRRLFGDHNNVVNLSEYIPPAFPDDHPKRRFGKNIRRNPNAPSTRHSNNCGSALSLKGRLQKVSMIPVPALECIVTLDSGTPPKIEQYLMTIGQFPDRSCPYFKEMSTKALGKRGQWSNRKHLYYIFMVICGLDPQSDVFMHATSFSFNEIKLVLQSGLLSHATS